MALRYAKSITLNGNSVIETMVNGVATKIAAEGYQAVINSDNPEDMTISSWQQDKALYKANRAQCRADSAEFEDLAYTLQDELLAAAAKVKE